MYMIPIKPQEVINEIRSNGYSLTDMAVLLNPQYEFRSDSYHAFKYWMKVGRMPKDKFIEMKRVLYGTL